MSDKDYSLNKLKESIVFHKKYLKFYKNKFIPITPFEEKDRKVKLRRFEYWKIIGFLFGYIAFNTFKKMRLSIKSMNLNTSLTPKSFFAHFLPSITAGAISFIFAHCMALKNLYKQTEYIRLRMFYEKTVDFKRQEGSKYADYPFAEKVPYLKNDLEISNKFKSKNKNIKEEDSQNLDKILNRKTDKTLDNNLNYLDHDALLEKRKFGINNIKERIFEQEDEDVDDTYDFNFDIDEENNRNDIKHNLEK